MIAPIPLDNTHIREPVTATFTEAQAAAIRWEANRSTRHGTVAKVIRRLIHSRDPSALDKLVAAFDKAHPGRVHPSP